MRAGRQRLVEELLPRIGVVPGGEIDPSALFEPPPRDIWLEVGFGGGEHLAEQARMHADVGMIGCEPFINGVARLLSEIERDGLENIRIHADDARDLIDNLPDASIGRAFVLFADPWQKIAQIISVQVISILMLLCPCVLVLFFLLIMVFRLEPCYLICLP